MLLNELGKAYRYLRCIPKTVYFNLKYLPFRDALKFPILVSHRVALRRMRGRIRVDQASLGRVKIGFRSNNIIDEGVDLAVWDVTGTVEFNGRVEIGSATKLLVSGHLSLGDDLWASGRSLISCEQRIEFGAHTLLSWDVTVIDHDFHPVSDLQTGEVLNEPKPVLVGKGVWVGAGATLLRGSVVGDGWFRRASHRAPEVWRNWARRCARCGDQSRFADACLTQPGETRSRGASFQVQGAGQAFEYPRRSSPDDAERGIVDACAGKGMRPRVDLMFQ